MAGLARPFLLAVLWWLVLAVKQSGQGAEIHQKNRQGPLAILNEHVYLASSGETVPGIAMIIA